MITIDDKNVKEYLNLYDDVKHNQEIILEYKDQIKEVETQIQKVESKIKRIESRMKSMLIKGDWYTYDLDINWPRPKKYTIKSVDDKYITVKEVVKKKPWKGFTGEHVVSFKGFLALKIYETEREALEDIKNNTYIHKLSRELARLRGDCEHYSIREYKIPKEKDGTGSVWLKRGAEITNREWLKNYKDKLHPNDDWTNVNLETYAWWIHLFNRNEADELLDNALGAGVVGYLD